MNANDPLNVVHIQERKIRKIPISSKHDPQAYKMFVADLLLGGIATVNTVFSYFEEFENMIQIMFSYLL